MTREDTVLECYLCGAPALWVVAIGGEDEPIGEEAACERHARGHRHRALLTAPAVLPPTAPQVR